MRLFVAIALLCLVQISQAQSPHPGGGQTHEEDNGTVSQQETEVENAETPVLVVANGDDPSIGVVQAPDTNSDADGEDETEYPDPQPAPERITDTNFLQQVRIADWTRVIAWATICSGIFAAIAAVFLYRNLRLTRRLVEQDRAWITHIDTQTFDSNIMGDQQRHIESIWRNDGKTPARDVRTLTRAKGITGPGIHEQDVPHIPADSTWHNHGGVGPGASLVSQVIVLKEDAAKINSGKKRLFILTAIKYRTIHDDRERITERVVEIARRVVHTKDFQPQTGREYRRTTTELVAVCVGEQQRVT